MASEHRPLGPFDIDDRTRAVLAILRHQRGVHGAAEIDADRLHDIEEAAAMRFENDLLGLFAAGVLAGDWDLKITKVLGHTGALAARRIRGDLLALGERNGWFVCVDKRSYGDGVTRVVLVDGDSRSEKAPVALAEWLETLAAELPDPGGSPLPFEPALIRKPQVSDSGRRVLHKTFGEGRVLTETGSGPTRKVKVDFPRVGLKLLQARFLEFLD